MPSITANSTDGYVTRYAQSSWSNARDNASGTAVASGGDRHYTAIAASKASGRAGTIYNIFRSFFSFDTTKITTKPNEARLYLRGYNQGGGIPVVLKSTSDISTLGTGDFNAIEGYSGGNYNRTDGIGGGSAVFHVTHYSLPIASWSTSGYNNIPLNSNALIDMAVNPVIYMVLVNHTHDLLDIVPIGLAQNGLYYVDAGSTTKPYIQYHESTPATFFGANF